MTRGGCVVLHGLQEECFRRRASDGEVPLRHSVVRGVLPVTGIFRYVVTSNRSQGRPREMISPMENRTEPKTVSGWIRYIVVAAIALFLVWWLLRLYIV